jgi:hypothetical protein
VEERSLQPPGFDLALLRRGEITAIIGAVITLMGLLALPWYGASQPHLMSDVGPGGTAPAEFGAWSGAGGLGALANVVVLFCTLAAIGVAVAGARGLELDGSGRRLMLTSLAATVAVLARIVFRPDAISGYSFDAGLRFGIFVTLIGTLVMVWGAIMRAQRMVRAAGLREPRAGRASGRSPDAGSRWSPRRSG